jgi:carbon-monoxide dehydrogenase iron sulfur subunit
MVTALKGKPILPRIRVEGEGDVTYAVSCRHCRDPICIRGCISGALHKEGGTVCIDREKCVGCLTCVLLCPYGAVLPGPDGAAMKCELCLKNACGEPACAAGCPNRAIVYEEREEETV